MGRRGLTILIPGVMSICVSNTSLARQPLDPAAWGTSAPSMTATTTASMVNACELLDFGSLTCSGAVARQTTGSLAVKPLNWGRERG